VTRTGWAVSPGEPLVVIAGDAGKALTVARTLHGVGLWNIAGVAAADPEGWRSKGLTVDQAEAWDLDRLATALGENAVELVDVRDPAEWAAGHVPGSHPLPLSTLGDGRTPVADLNGGTIAVACALGGRAALAASLLRRAGHPDVVRVGGGGIPDLARRGMALER
jgi:hydroxyacylglutathione hydrolase